jgi:hypothetical protein
MQLAMPKELQPLLSKSNVNVRVLETVQEHY